MPAGAVPLTYPRTPAAIASSATGDFSDDAPLRRIAFVITLGLIFVRFGMFQFVLVYLTQRTFYLLYLFGIPSLLGVALSGGIQRGFRGRPTWFWIAFALWLVAAIPFSTWQGGSFYTVLGFLRVEFPMLFVMALAVTWRECRTVIYAIALSAVVCLAAGWFMRRDGGGARLTLALGTMANANDFAAHLLLILPFLLWVALSANFKLFRVAAFAGVGVGCYLILMTGSRGAVVAIAVCVLLVLLRGPWTWRATLLLLAPVAIVLLVTLVPLSILARITSFTVDANSPLEAVASMQLRQMALQRSLMDTLQHPLFGVGPAQFSNFEGQLIDVWRVPHNTYTEISSECGVPALIFYVGGIVSTLLLFNSVYGQARRRRDCTDIRNGALCAMIGITGYCVASTFLSLAYMFYMPAMAGFAVAFSTGARREMQEREARSAAAAPPMARYGPPELPFRRPMYGAAAAR